MSETMLHFRFTYYLKIRSKDDSVQDVLKVVDFGTFHRHVASRDFHTFTYQRLIRTTIIRVI